MKLLVCVVIASVLSCISKNAVSQIKPYIAVVNTGSETFRGVLYNVTANGIMVKRDTADVFFSACDIKSIKLKVITGRTKYKKYLNYDPYFEKNYRTVSNKMVAVRKWGEKGPTMEEELSCRILSGFLSAALSGLAAPINMMNGSAVFNVNYDQTNYSKEMQTIASHSVMHQRNLEGIQDAQQLKLVATN